MGQLTTRQERKRQLARYGYAGVGGGALVLLIAILSASIVLGVIGIVVLVVAAWITRMIRSL
jgi:hypothetical protein